MPAITADTLTPPRVLRPDPASNAQRPVRSVITVPAGFEGDGFPVRRAFAGVSHADLDPFIHMDQMGEIEWAPGEPIGAPWHPHRGFETATYIIDGTFEFAVRAAHSEYKLLCRPRAVGFAHPRRPLARLPNVIVTTGYGRPPCGSWRSGWRCGARTLAAQSIGRSTLTPQGDQIACRTTAPSTPAPQASGRTELSGDAVLVRLCLGRVTRHLQ
jgi:Pirin